MRVTKRTAACMHGLAWILHLRSSKACRLRLHGPDMCWSGITARTLLLCIGM